MYTTVSHATNMLHFVAYCACVMLIVCLISMIDAKAV
jgi:hypothetical protein